MSWSDSGETRCFAILAAAKEGLHRFVEPEVDLLQELIVDPVEFGIVLATGFERLLGRIHPRPALPSAQAHDPPVI